jgi:hypothetical protein
MLLAGKDVGLVARSTFAAIGSVLLPTNPILLTKRSTSTPALTRTVVVVVVVVVVVARRKVFRQIWRVLLKSILWWRN